MDAAAAGLLSVVDMLRSEPMENQGRLLGIGSLLDELRAAATSFHNNIANRTEMLEGFALRMLISEIAQLRYVLEEVLSRQARAAAWYQVPALSLSNLIFRRATAHKLRLSLMSIDHALSDTPAAPRLVRMDTFDLARKAMLQARKNRKIRMDAVQCVDLVGRAELVEKLVRILLAGVEDGPLVVVPIVGGPGIGKTHLARFLFNDNRVEQEFHVRLWVNVSPCFDLSKVLASLLSRPFNIAQHQEDNKDLRLALHRSLQGGSYLIVQDNVWDVGHRQEWPEWDTLMQALPPNGKIILTTRTPAIVPRTATIVHVRDICIVCYSPLL